MQGEVTQVNHSKQGTQVTIETENEGRVILFSKDPAYSVYQIGQVLSIEVNPVK